MKKNLNKTSQETSHIPDGYRAFLEDLKLRIRSSQAKAIIKVNEELIKLYWEIGSSVISRPISQ